MANYKEENNNNKVPKWVPMFVTDLIASICLFIVSMGVCCRDASIIPYGIYVVALLYLAFYVSVNIIKRDYNV